jgi:hypothetical protein
MAQGVAIAKPTGSCAAARRTSERTTAEGMRVEETR